MSRLANTPAALLVGGKGTRLSSVLPSTAKPLAPVGSQPFLELLVRQLAGQGVQKIVMCTGHLADQVEAEFGDGNAWGVAITYSRESSPLGTAGAIKLAERHLEGAPEFIAMNGDSMIDLDLDRLLAFHRSHKGVATIAVSHVDDASRYGAVQIEGERVVRFEEKSSTAKSGFINAGVYVLDRSVLSTIPEGVSSLERDVFPLLVNQGMYALEQPGLFIDIGVPESYERAQAISNKLRDMALGNRQAQ